MHVRPARPESDIQGIAAIVNTFEREPLALDTVQGWFEHMPPGRIARRMVATDDHDSVIGYSVILHESWWPDHHFYLWLAVDPQWRQRGLGLALYQDAQALLEAQGAALLRSEVQDDDAVSLRFAERHGFAVERHLFASRLDLTAFDEAPYGSLLATQDAAGIRFFTMADVGDSPAARHKLYELNANTGLDIPGADGSYMPFDEFERWVCGARWYNPAGQLLAADGDRWIGLCAVQLLPKAQGAHNLMTGVLEPYRGRKIALALKLLAIRYAREHGARYIRTDNDSLNAPMLAINQKLGYKPQPGKYLLIKVGDVA
jgi:ribosomal protein S18 acetylase RimI-like enzyme